MADFVMTASMRNSIDIHKIQELAKKNPVILVGFPSGRIHVEAEHTVGEDGKRRGGARMSQKAGEDRETADLAAELHYGSAKTPARPFLNEGLEKNKKELLEILNKQLQKEVPNWHLVGTLAVAKVREFVRSDYYKTTVPNAPYTIEQKGSDTPLIDGSDLIESMQYDIKGGTV